MVILLFRLVIDQVEDEGWVDKNSGLFSLPMDVSFEKNPFCLIIVGHKKRTSVFLDLKISKVIYHTYNSNNPHSHDHNLKISTICRYNKKGYPCYCGCVFVSNIKGDNMQLLKDHIVNMASKIIEDESQGVVGAGKTVRM